MTQKTINCAECGVQVTYNVKEGFPRKYCFNCSEAKKASFKHASESRPTHTPEGEPADNISGKSEYKIRMATVDDIKPFEAHLSIETVRSNALASAIQMKLNVDFYRDISPIDLAKKYEKYILTGE